MIWFRPELRVLFVCTANLCRSPLAEGMLRHRLREKGLADRVEVRSAGTCTAQRGCRPDPRVVALAAEAGYSLGGIRARALTPRMIQRSDYVLVMEHRHLEEVERLCAGLPLADNGAPADGAAPGACIQARVQLLGRFLPLCDDHGMEIPDPYFSDLHGLREAHELIELAVSGILADIEVQLAEPRRC